jgi:stringent starvation protein B
MHPSEQKLSIARLLLPMCPFIQLDATLPDVQVPEFLHKADLILRIGEDPKVLGMPDLVLDEAGFRATISVQGMRRPVDVPWAAVYRMWVGEPFLGPFVMWGPHVLEVERTLPPTKPSRPVALRAVK